MGETEQSWPRLWTAAIVLPALGIANASYI